MANIIIKSECGLYDGMPVTFKAPCACNAVEGLKVQYGDEAAVFMFKDAHGNDLTGIGNLFDKGAIVKAVLDTESGSAFVQNADTNAYLEGRFADMVSSVNGQKGNVILTPDRIGAAGSSVDEITVIASSKKNDTIRTNNLLSKLYTAGHLFVLEIPSYQAGGDGFTDTVDCSAMPDGYRIVDVRLEHSQRTSLGFDPLSYEVNNDSQTVKIKGFVTVDAMAIRVYGVVDGDAASGTGGAEPDWVQAVIDTAQRAEATAEEAKAGTETFAAQLDALDTGLSDANKGLSSLTQAQDGMSKSLSTATQDITSIKQDIEQMKKSEGNTADLSALEAKQGVERVDEDGKTYIRGKAATSLELGMVKVTQENGVGIGSDGQLKIRKAEKQTIAERKSDYQPIVPSTLEHAVQSVTHQQMGDKYYPDDMGFENGSALPVSYAAMKAYIGSKLTGGGGSGENGKDGVSVTGATVTPIN